MKSIPTLILCCLASTIAPVDAFAVCPSRSAASCPRRPRPTPTTSSSSSSSSSSSFARPRRLDAAVVPDLGIVGLVAGQENYGLAIVAMGEALWSFAQSPSLEHAKVLLPASIAAVTLFALSGPMITSGDVGTVALGLEIATGVSVLLGASYVARLVAPYSPSAKEAAFAGLLIAVAGFFSFSQNLVVDGFVTLPSLPSLPLPEMPLGLGESIDTDRY